MCNLEIKPWEADQDLKALYAKIKKTVVKDGLKWSEAVWNYCGDLYGDNVASMAWARAKFDFHTGPRV